ncbi:hypothetical protein [Nitratireductor sp.]|uniref:hypothetical protein n=1 Tax=Nitratireductor sp. TaxID=1872084 RepID=UPI002637A46D|nr:hypothetical protein [Nitratireductor sp.]MCV0381717.1 hypothetical protein [Nitratireductor sp.]
MTTEQITPNSPARSRPPEFFTALKYLEQEAERSGHADLTKLLKTVLVIAESSDDVFALRLNEFLNTQDMSEDTHLAVDFLFRFLLSDNAVQQEVMKRIEDIEDGRASRPSLAGAPGRAR